MDRLEKKYLNWKRTASEEEQARVKQMEWEEFVNMNADLVEALNKKELDQLVKVIEQESNPKELDFYGKISFIFTYENGTKMDAEAKRVLLSLAWAKLDAML